MKRLIIMALLASGTWAADFSHMSTEEMLNMRGSVSVDDRPSFQQEMQKRMQSMTPQERQKYNMRKNKGKGMLQKGMNNQPTFSQFDLNNDGKITPKELEEGRAERIKQNTKEGRMMRNVEKASSFTDIDTNKDGTISKEEFRLHKIKYPQGCVSFG